MSLFDSSCGGVESACVSIQATTGAALANSSFQNNWGQAYGNLSNAYNNTPAPTKNPGPPTAPQGTEEYYFQEFKYELYNAINNAPTDNGDSMLTFLNNITNPTASGYNSSFINFVSNAQIVSLQNAVAQVVNQNGDQTQQNLETTVSSLKTLVQQSEQTTTSPQQLELQTLQNVNGQMVAGMQTISQTGGVAASFGQIIANCLQSMG